MRHHDKCDADFVAHLAHEVERPLSWLPPRLRRLVAQRRDHRLYRLNYYLPIGGAGGASQYWPVGRWVKSRFSLHVPTGAKPGEFRLLMRVEAVEFAPNVDARYYVEDDDSTPGGALDSLLVLPPAPGPAAGG